MTHEPIPASPPHSLTRRRVAHWRVWGGIALFMVVVGVAGMAGEVETATPGEQQLPAFDAWYRFGTPDSLGRSTGLTPWPAVVHAGAWTPGGRSLTDGALSLTGANANGLLLPNPASFFGTMARQGTICLWVRAAVPVPESPHVLFDAMVSTGNTLIDGHEIVMFVDGGQLVAWPALPRRLAIPNPLGDGQWVHLALTWNCTSGAHLFVNGGEVASSEGEFEPVTLSSDWPMRFGCHTVAGGYAFAGMMDDIRLLNRDLPAAAIAEIYSMDPERPAVRAVLGKDATSLYITNKSARPTEIGLDQWLPGRTLEPPWHGFVPTDFGSSVWTAAVVSPHVIVPATEWAAGTTAIETAAFPTDYWGPGRIRVLAGTGLGRQEIPLSRLYRRWFREVEAPASFAILDREGLRLEVRRTMPFVFPAGSLLTVPIRATNDTSRDLAADLTVTLHGRGGKIQARTTWGLKLAPAAQTETNIDFDVRMGRGRFDLRFTMGQGENDILVYSCPVYGTDERPPDQFCAVGAAYTDRPDDEAVLADLAADGVGVVRLGGKTDGASFRHNLEAVMTYGMKAWRTPAFAYGEVCADPEKRAELGLRASVLGRSLRDNLAVVNQNMAGEGLSAPPCYCDHCNQDFRMWLQRRFGTLRRLNAAWHSAYASWESIQQLGSPADVDMAAERLKMMQVALELPPGNTERWQRLFELDPPRAMAWRRWHDDLLLAWYRDFAMAFKRENGGTVPIGEQPCWPNFKTHVFFPLAGTADMGGMDLYLPGEMATTLGYASELFLNFDMNASLYTCLGKPVMVHELYVQDLSPERLPEAQGWWLLGRGYNMMTFFTYTYYHEGTRAGLPLIFGLHDPEGKAYPSYASFKRFSVDMFQFDAHFDVSAMRRVEPRVAIFLGDDMSIANILESGGATWEADGVKGHVGSYWLTQRNGYAVEVINDETFQHLDREQVLVVPYSPVIRPESIGRILAVARRGGTVIIDGPFAQFDGNHVPYDVCPGGGSAEALGVRCSGFGRETRELVLPDGAHVPARGGSMDLQLAPEVTVLCRDTAGEPAVLGCSLGRGTVFWALAGLGAENRTRAPDPRLLAYWGSLLRHTGVQPRFSFCGDTTVPATVAAVPLDLGGKGIADSAPLFDVSLRILDERDLFVFAVSFFAPSAGALSLALPNGSFTVTDALSGEPMPVSWNRNVVTFPLDLEAFGARVLRLSATQDGTAPFADW